MREKIIHSLYASLEWRAIAFIITNIFFYFTTNSFWKAAGLALILQLVLFLSQTLWHFIRYEHGLDELPHPDFLPTHKHEERG